jgi:hypothetical protein
VHHKAERANEVTYREALASRPEDVALLTAEYVRLAVLFEERGALVRMGARSNGRARNGVEDVARRRRHCWPDILFNSRVYNRAMDANALVRELFGGGSLSLEVHSFPSLQPGAAEPNQSRHSCRAEPERQAATPPPNITLRRIARPVRLICTRLRDTRVCLDRLPFAMSTKIQVLSVDARCDSLYYRTITR